MNIKDKRQWAKGRSLREYLIPAACSTLLLLMMVFLAGISSAEDPITHLKEETLSYFYPHKGNVVSVKDNVITSDLGIESGIKAGMRFTVIREGAPFLHPVTKELMGKAEAKVGTAVVKDISTGTSALSVIQGDINEGDKLKISETLFRVLFYQEKTVDWGLAEAYYRMLKESGRFEIIDTPLDSGDDPTIIAEAKKLNAHVALVLRAEGSGKDAILRQKLFWVDDSSMLAEEKVHIDTAAVKDLKSGGDLFADQAISGGDALLHFELPFRARLITSGDIDGDGKQELIISAGRHIKAYTLGAGLQVIYELETPASDDHLWLDTQDINADGRDEILITYMRDNDIVSCIYELRGGKFYRLWEGKLFLRKFNKGIIAQGYDKSEGFGGPVYSLIYETGSFRKGSVLKLPDSVNIYDFILMPESDSGYVLAYDDNGYINLYSKNGIRVWQSRGDYGKFLTTFKKASPTVMTDRGEWAIKDRLILKDKELIAIRRIPLANIARGLGYKGSQIITLWWTGLSMEEKTLIEDVPGGILDYTVAGDKLIVITTPLFGITPKKILKGENPFVNMLYIYSLKGR